jgi:hypothetical protein
MKATRKDLSFIGFSFLQVHRYTLVIVDSFRIGFALSDPNLTSAQHESFARRQQQRQGRSSAAISYLIRRVI